MVVSKYSFRQPRMVAKAAVGLPKDCAILAGQRKAVQKDNHIFDQVQVQVKPGVHDPAGDVIHDG